MSLAQWHASGPRENIPDLLNRIFGRFLSFVEPSRQVHAVPRQIPAVKPIIGPATGPMGRMIAATNWSPAEDVTEMESEYLIVAEIPVVKRSNVKVTFSNGILTMKGECKTGRLTVVDERYTDKNKTFQRVERTYGSFVRCYQLPDDADGNNVRAEFEDGILRATVAKKDNHTDKGERNVSLICNGMNTPVCELESGEVCAVKALRRIMAIKS